MTRKAMITWGGWDGHEPEKVANLFRGILEADGGEHETGGVAGEGIGRILS